MTRRLIAGLGATVSVFCLTDLPAFAQDQACVAPSDCAMTFASGNNTGGVTALPIAPIVGDGFSISIDSSPAAGTWSAPASQSPADIRFSQDDIQVRFDGLGVRPRLDVQTAAPGPFAPGDAVTFFNRMNYPYAVTGGELRILDLDAPGGIQTLAVLPMAPNGEISVTLPTGTRLAYVYRVTDANGRFDETRPVLLGTSRDVTRTDLETEEQGRDSAAIRAIPVRGGAVTVFVQNLAPGSRVVTLGTTITPDVSGSAVVQRVLPVGQQSIAVRVIGPDGRATEITREVTIPTSDWFYVGTVDVSIGRATGDGPAGQDEAFETGRISGYATGTTASGYQITAQVDSGEDELGDLFSNILDKDPSSIIDRIDPDLAYPTYGDDSTLDIDAPTSGGMYLRVEKDSNFLLWGDFKSETAGTELLSNERTLYGAQTVLQTQGTNADGQPRLRFEGYAAQADQLPQRDVLRGTGGSIYFLSKQDLLVGSETLTIELRDGNTQRLISRTTLIQGKDYDINYTQGVVTLYSPLSGYGPGGALLSANPNGDDTLNLVAQYEWQPASGDVSGYSYGARLTSGIADGLQLGASFQVEQGGMADQTAYGVDLSWRKSDRTFLTAEVARTDGPGYGYITSLNGGLTGTTTDAPDGSGTAYRVNAQAALDELSSGLSGTVSAYFESFDAGFSSLDYQITDPELYWGVSADLPLGNRLSIALSYDSYEEDPGVWDKQGKVILTYQLSDTVSAELGWGHVDAANPDSTDETGTRDDLAGRLNWTVSETANFYGYAQGSYNITGTLESANRVGVGAELAFGKTWSLAGEVSAGASGPGARILIGQDKGADSNVYFGYTLDPNRTVDGFVLTGQDEGQVVVGGRRRYSDSVTAFAENTYDLFGQQQSMNATYGITYARSDRTVYTGAIETGIVTGDPQGKVNRTSVSLGVRHDESEALSTRGRVEVIVDQSDVGTVNTLLFSGLMRYDLTSQDRIVANLDAMFNNTETESLPQGNYVNFITGYALRPILDDRLNVLAKYQYLDDMVAQTFDDRGNMVPIQRSNVFSIDAEYDLSNVWTIGGKLGFRLTESAPDAEVALSANDAWLAVANARYHLVNEWDVLVEARNLTAVDSETSNFGVLAGAYKQLGPHVEVGVSYNFGTFSDDLTDLIQDDQGVEINFIAKF
ncbi:MAG: hypothetical protein NTX73_12070 [Rhodobacterales bacterium]|nr:hypothetical protein [Rhodobacterales bacterium]